ncbi:unnamed protein product [Urochloa humidicola]
MSLPCDAVPDIAAPPAAFNIDDDTTSAIFNTGVDLLHQTDIPHLAMASGSGSWTDLLTEVTDVDAISLSMPLDDLGSTQTKVAKAKRARNYTHEEDIQLCVS